MHRICPTVGFCAINIVTYITANIRTNSTLIRDNLYQDNTHMNQTLSQRILFWIVACFSVFVSHTQILRCWGPDTPFIFQGIVFSNV